MPKDEQNSADWLPSDWLGLGLDRGTVGLTDARPEWGRLAERLAQAIREALGVNAVDVEHVGSTAVPSLVAKPIIDLAVGLKQVDRETVKAPLDSLGYEFRGDAGDAGGLVFVLSDRPLHRVAHLHVVEYGGDQWHRYLAFRDLLLEDASARAIYERTKTELAEEFVDSRKEYTAAKDQIIDGLLAERRSDQEPSQG